MKWRGGGISQPSALWPRIPNKDAHFGDSPVWKDLKFSNLLFCIFFYHWNLVLILAPPQNFWWPWAHHFSSLLARPLDLSVSDVFPASKFYLGRHFLKPMIKRSLCYTVSFCWQRRNRCCLKSVFCALTIALRVRNLEWQLQAGCTGTPSPATPSPPIPRKEVTTGRRRWHSFCLNYQPLLL